MDRLLSLVVTEWLADIRQNQVPAILGGVGPMYSVLQLVQGVKDLFLLPIEQYQKDGRYVWSKNTVVPGFEALGPCPKSRDYCFELLGNCQQTQGGIEHPDVKKTSNFEKNQ